MDRNPIVRRAERWIQVLPESADSLRPAAGKHDDQWCVLLLGTYDGQPDPETFLVIQRTRDESEARWYADELADILAQILEGEGVAP